MKKTVSLIVTIALLVCSFSGTCMVAEATTQASGIVYQEVAPEGLNSAQIYGGKSGPFNAQADAMRDEILSYADTLKDQSGTKYYVSQANGDDANDGLSPDTAWKTLDKLNSTSFASGSIVLFERGGAYRGQLIARSGVSYGAYGTGTKPALYGSRQNYATATWVADSTRTNVYYYESDLNDVGIVVINHGAIKSIRQKSVGALASRSAKDGWYYTDGSRVYVYSKNGNPSDVYASIEIGEDKNIVSASGCTNTTFENISFKYTGGHGLAGDNTENVVIRGCEFGWIGGSLLGDTPYGNAIEWWGNCKDNTVQDCWIYQCYDTGWTFQSSSAASATGQKFIDNLVEYCWYSTEMWIGGAAEDVTMDDIQISGNIMRFAGYCWGTNFREDQLNSSHIFISSNVGNATNFVVSNNIFEGGYQHLFGQTASMTFDGNTYVQTQTDSSVMSMTYDLPYDENAAQTIKDVVGDQNATVLYSEWDCATHTYTDVCDEECDVCYAIRTAPHSYTDACDTDCNICGVTRTAPHNYDNACDYACNDCGTERVPADHVYDSDCDADCNVCGETRTVSSHEYDNDCDTDCNLCGATREVADHVYDNDCDVDCNVCGTVRESGGHAYDDACDTACNECGEIREVSAHVYDDILDTDCNECGMTRTATKFALRVPYTRVYQKGASALDLTGGCIDIAYENGQAGSVDLTADMITGFDGSTVGTQTVTVTCGGMSDTFDVVVTDATALPTISVDNVITSADSGFTVAVRVKNNPGIVSALLEIYYDETKLELVSYTEQDFTGLSYGPVDVAPFIVNWCDAINTDNTTDGVIALLTFKVKADVELGQTTIAVNYDAENVYNYDFDNVTFNASAGTVNIVDDTLGDIDGDGEINNKDFGLLQRFINEWDVTINESAADINSDGIINNKDLGILQRHINGWDTVLNTTTVTVTTTEAREYSSLH